MRHHPATVVNEFGSSELKRCEAEIIELLTEEAEAEAAWEAMLAAVPETDRLPNEEYEGLLELDLEHQNELFEWIEDNIMPAPEGAERYRHDSYELKHVFEREGFYVTDEQFRAAMWLSGYHGSRYPGRRYEDIETRFYFVRQNTDGILRRLLDRGAVSGWARRALLD
jgi:hypothetical protein